MYPNIPMLALVSFHTFPMNGHSSLDFESALGFCQIDFVIIFIICFTECQTFQICIVAVSCLNTLMWYFLFSNFLFQTDGLTLIAEEDWRLLCEEWGGTESKCISAQIEVDNGVEDNTTGSYKEVPISEYNVNLSDEVNMSLLRKPIVNTSPQVFWILGLPYLCLQW